MRKKTTLLITIAFFWLFPAGLKPQVPGNTDGGKIKFQSQKEMVVTTISGQLTRCETYMDYLATGGWCRSFPTKIGYVTDFSLGYIIRLYSEDYEAGDSFRWNFKGPNKQNITGGFDCLVENGFYCWVSTNGSKSCPSSPGKPAAIMQWSIYPQNFPRPDRITGQWTIIITRNGVVMAEDSFTILPAEIDDRERAKEELDRKWETMTQDERKDVVSSRSEFNDFLGSIAHVTERYISEAIDLAKEAYPQYRNFDADLAKAIIQKESSPYGNYFSLGRYQELGLAQEKSYCDTDRTPATIVPYTNFQALRKSDLADQDFEDFKTGTFADNRSLVIESLAILFSHVTELMSESYIGYDIKKIAAAYNWGQANLKKWLDFCTEQNIDWYENLENVNYRHPEINIEVRRRVARYINDILSNYPQKSRK